MSSSLILHNNEPFLYQIMMCNKKWILYCKQQWPAQSLDQKEAPKHSPKAKLLHKKVMVTVWWFAAGLFHYSFLNSGDTTTSEKYAQQIGEMNWKLQCLHLALVNRKCPILIQDNVQPHITQQMLQKLDDWTTKFWLICHIHLISRQLMGTSSSISMTFCRENTSTTSRMQKMLSKSLLNPEVWF